MAKEGIILDRGKQSKSVNISDLEFFINYD
jgi:hypothetical protein